MLLNDKSKIIMSSSIHIGKKNYIITYLGKYFKVPTDTLELLMLPQPLDSHLMNAQVPTHT